MINCIIKLMNITLAIYPLAKIKKKNQKHNLKRHVRQKQGEKGWGRRGRREPKRWAIKQEALWFEQFFALERDNNRSHGREGVWAGAWLGWRSLNGCITSICRQPVAIFTASRRTFAWTWCVILAMVSPYFYYLPPLQHSNAVATCPPPRPHRRHRTGSDCSARPDTYWHCVQPSRSTCPGESAAAAVERVPHWRQHCSIKPSCCHCHWCRPLGCCQIAGDDVAAAVAVAATAVPCAAAGAPPPNCDSRLACAGIHGCCRCCRCCDNVWWPLSRTPQSRSRIARAGRPRRRDVAADRPSPRAWCCDYWLKGTKIIGFKTKKHTQNPLRKTHFSSLLS